MNVEERKGKFDLILTFPVTALPAAMRYILKAERYALGEGQGEKLYSIIAGSAVSLETSI
ncbi:hypothetical protein [Nostoc sp.]|uniref:hypothetical protein n=1 Tax=Nostoc sp. TaxID=1180 RepID=UPI002FF868CD